MNTKKLIAGKKYTFEGREKLVILIQEVSESGFFGILQTGHSKEQKMYMGHYDINFKEVE